MPELDAQADDGESGGGPVGFDGVEDDDREKEQTATVGEADLGLGDDDGIVSGFDGVEEEQGSDSDDNNERGGPGESPSIESAIENGLSEVAAIGLEGEERERVYTEMNAIAGKFKIGYFGNECVQKYLKRDIDDIPPEYGLVAALIAFGAIAVYKRPDGEERVQEAVSIVKEKMKTDDTPSDAPREPPREPQPQRPVQQPQPSPPSAAPESGRGGAAQADPGGDEGAAGAAPRPDDASDEAAGGSDE